MKQIGNYRILDKLGEGAFGAVYRAQDLRDHAIVALKVLKDSGSIERFRREAQLLYQQLENKHIVRLLDHALDHNPPFIVTEYCAGGTLRAWVSYRMPWQETARAIRHAAVGLSAIHTTGGFHRDVKPDNLLLWLPANGKGNCIKLCDLGIGRGAAGLLSPHATTNAMGTRGYMAPELAKGTGFCASADIYSLGVTALELLTGARDIAGLALSPCPEELRAIVRRMLHGNPATRPTAFDVARFLLRLNGKSAWTLQAPAPPQVDWGAMAVIGLAAIGVAAVLKK